MLKAGMATSISDARRKVEQGGVSIDGGKIMDYKFELNKKNHDKKVIKAGKLHFSKIKFA